MKRIILIVLDSVGIGEAPDAVEYGDVGAATLPNLAEAVGGLQLPTLTALGLGNIPALLPSGKAIRGVDPLPDPQASYGAMRERSEGKDTITGHWEIAGLEMRPGFSLFPAGPPSFSEALIAEFERRVGRRVLGNRHASGTRIIEELGQQHMREGALIVYTSADSVFQIAAHVDVVPLQELYRACEIARELCNPLRVGRVIARPFTGQPGRFVRTADRKDFPYETAEPTVLQRLDDAGVPVYAVGKIEDIFGGRGIRDSVHTGDTQASQEAVTQFTEQHTEGLIFANFIDFDTHYGHRRDPEGYAGALVQTDHFFKSYLPLLSGHDTLIVTADHGNDPTFQGSDHTREYVPLLVYRPGQPARNLGRRDGFYDVAQSIAAAFHLSPLPRGSRFLDA